MKDIFELAAGDTTTAEVQGSSFTAYELSPVEWLKEIVDAAKKKYYAAQLVYTTDVPSGTKDVVIPKRSLYMAPADWEASVGEGVAVNFTKISNLDGVTLTPADANYAVAISNRAIRTNALDVLKAAKEELINSAGDLVDQAVFTALKANANAAATGTRGAQTCYGGDARAESELAAGDTISTDMVADAKRKLMSTTCKFWVPSSPAAEAVCSVKKNPWSSDPSDPFTALIAPEQENIFLKDSQFVNAAEYGGNEIVMNGEVGKYLGIKILVAPNTPAVASGGTALDGGSVAGTAMHRAIMLKGKKAAALAWGQRPKLRVFPFDRELETDLVLEMAYQAKVLHTDAMVFLDVADE